MFTNGGGSSEDMVHGMTVSQIPPIRLKSALL